MNIFETSRGIGNNIARGTQQAQDRTAIDDILQQASQTGNPQDIDLAINQILSRVSPERQQMAIGVLANKKQEILGNQEIRKAENLISQDRARKERAYHEQGFPTNFGELDSDTRKSILEKQNPKKEKTPEGTAAKQINTARGKKYVAAEESLEKSGDYLRSLERLDKLADNLSGITGSIKAYSGFSEDAAELNAAGTTVIEPIIKLFNPTGALSDTKIKRIQEYHSPKATDSTAKIKGKINAIKIFAEAARDRSKKFLELMDNYDYNPPKEALEEYRKQSEAILDLFDKPVEEQNFNKKILKVVGPDGQEYEMDEDMKDQLPQGYKII